MKLKEFIEKKPFGIPPNRDYTKGKFKVKCFTCNIIITSSNYEPYANNRKGD